MSNPYTERNNKIKQAAETLGIELDPFNHVMPGDLYIACRNGEAQLLTCKEHDKKNGWIVPKEVDAYPFDIHECVRVKP